MEDAVGGVGGQSGAIFRQIQNDTDIGTTGTCSGCARMRKGGIGFRDITICIYLK